jgi:hypothetical protein
MTRKQAGSASPWTGRGTGNGPWNCGPAPRGGSGLARRRCRCGGSSLLTRDPAGKRPAKALFSTDQAQSAEEIVRDFMKRWSLAATVAESRAHLGIETQRQWSDRASERTTPLLFGLYRLVALFGSALAPAGHPPVQRASWYQQSVATFSDILALGRRHLWGHFRFPTARSDPTVVFLPRATLAQ